jgi:fumarate reductase flavoprotein subunit
MDGDGFNMCHKAGAGHTPVTMELMYQLPDNMNHFYVEGAFRQPCYWCNRLGERFIPEDEVFNTTFVGNAINHLPGKVGFAIFSFTAILSGSASIVAVLSQLPCELALSGLAFIL